MRWEWNAELLRHDLLTREWTQQELAQAAKVTASAVSRMLNNGSCSLKMAGRIAKALGRPLTDYARQDEGETNPRNDVPVGDGSRAV